MENCRFFQGQGRKISQICQKLKFPDSEKKAARYTHPTYSEHLYKIYKTIHPEL